MRLYEIDAALEACIDQDTGEVINFDRLNELQIARDEKLEGVAIHIKSLMAEAKALKEEIKNLQDRKSRVEKKADGYREWLQHVLAGEPFRTAKVDIRYKSSTSLAVDEENESALIKWLFLTGHGECVVTRQSLVKGEVKKLLKEGVAVPYAALEEKQNMSVK